jgi:hypothetical protein
MALYLGRKVPAPELVLEGPSTATVLAASPAGCVSNNGTIDTIVSTSSFLVLPAGFHSLTIHEHIPGTDEEEEEEEEEEKEMH